MLPLLEDNDEFRPMHVVENTGQYEQLKASMNREPEVIPGLVAFFRKNREKFKVVSN